MSRKKIYIGGCGGMLGEAFYMQFKEKYELKCTDIDVNENWLSFLDFRDYHSYIKDVCDFSPDYLFHLGAYTDLEYCEDNIDDTYVTNTLSVENAVFLANELKIPLLYISTAGIFDGKKELYELIKNCHYVVCPSECYDNFPYGVLEAFAFRKPVVGSRIGGIPEIIVENKTGLLFEPGNSLDLIE